MIELGDEMLHDEYYDDLDREGGHSLSFSECPECGHDEMAMVAPSAVFKAELDDYGGLTMTFRGLYRGETSSDGMFFECQSCGHRIYVDPEDTPFEIFEEQDLPLL